MHAIVMWTQAAAMIERVEINNWYAIAVGSYACGGHEAHPAIQSLDWTRSPKTQSDDECYAF